MRRATKSVKLYPQNNQSHGSPNGAQNEFIIRNSRSSESAESQFALDELGIFQRVRDLVLHDYTQNQIAEELCVDRSYIQKRINLAKLPKEVQAEFIKHMNHEPTNVRWSHVSKLYELYRRGGRSGYIDGGPDFQTFWKQCKSGLI